MADDEPTPAPDPTPDTHEPETPQVGQGVFMGRIDSNQIEIQITKYPLAFAISEELKAELNANPDKYAAGSLVEFGYIENPADAPYTVTVTWMNVKEQSTE